MTHLQSGARAHGSLAQRQPPQAAMNWGGGQSRRGRAGEPSTWEGTPGPPPRENRWREEVMELPVFMAVVEKPAIKYVDEKVEGSIIGCDPVAVIVFAAEGGDPHDLADQMGELRGKRVRVQVTLERPELFTGDGEGEGHADSVPERPEMAVASAEAAE